MNGFITAKTLLLLNVPTTLVFPGTLISLKYFVISFPEIRIEVREISTGRINILADVMRWRGLIILLT